jgi:ubiquinol-cytochrome c reductase cytochrome b subunit
VTPARPGRLARVYSWMDERLGISQTILPVITHPVPAKLGWSYVLGSATLIAFVIMVVTGVALAMNYVPSTEDAYNSLQFITNDAFFGRTVRGLHYFGAGAMVTLVFAHLVQVFLIASYKYPRELNWVSGSMLLLLTLAMAFSGQLLRWEQNAYWAIVVAAEQAGKAPLVGPWLMQVILAGWTIGPATLTRFYATHVFLLPALIFLFLGVHLYLVIHVGISETPRAGHPVDRRTYPAYYGMLLRRGEPFFPDSFWRDAAAGLLLIGVLLALAIAIGPPVLEQPPDPTNVQAYPRPDWYFLWYLALLAVVPASAETLTILGVPIVIGLILIGLPFLAPYGERAPSRRPWAVASVVMMFTAFMALTYYGWRAPWSPVIVGASELPYPPGLIESLTPEQQRGSVVFQSYGCRSCHALGGIGGRSGPDLMNVGDRYDSGTLVQTILRGRGNMPAFAGSIPSEELSDLVSFLEALRRGVGQDTIPGQR